MLKFPFNAIVENKCLIFLYLILDRQVILDLFYILWNIFIFLKLILKFSQWFNQR